MIERNKMRQVASERIYRRYTSTRAFPISYFFSRFSPYASIIFKATLPREPQMRRKRRNEPALESSQVET